MSLCLPLEMSLSKELLWAYSLSSKTTLMTGNWGVGWGTPVCQTDIRREKGPADLCGPICHDRSVDGCLCYVPAVTEPSPMTHLNTLKSASDFHSLYLNFYGGSYPAVVCGAPCYPSTCLPPGSVSHRACHRPDLSPGLDTQQFLRNCLLPE